VTAAKALGDVVQLFDNSVCVVTTVGDGERSGCLVGFASQASIEPPRFLAGISVENHTYRVLQKARWLAVHVLRDDQRELAELFGALTGDDVDKFGRCEWQPGPHDVPVLSASAGWFVGEVIDQLDMGDHVGFLVAVETGEVRDEAPIRPLRIGAVNDISAGHDE
jgi:flavin reductase (DIM6/NTAB) family NADH-FMN oxidoreductase RutF